MPDIADSLWAEVDDLNSDAAPNGFPPGMPAYIDQIGRMMMGAIKRSWGRQNPVYETTGTADAYIVSPASAPNAINLYEIIYARIDRANTTTTPTFQYGMTNPRTIMKIDATGKIALAVGDLVAGNSHGFWYDGTEWILINPGTIEISEVPGLQAALDAKVTGPASATDGNFAVFDGATGKLVKDSGENAASFASASEGALAASAIQPTATDASSFGFVAKKNDAPADPSKVLPTAERVDTETVYKAADRTAMKALSGTTHLAVYLMEAGREGTFQWDPSNLSTEVAADTQEGIYVAPTSDTTGASGAWVRTLGSVVAPIASPAIRTIESRLWDRADLRDWDGLDLTNNNDNASLVQAALNAGAGGGYNIHAPAGNMALGSQITVPPNASLIGRDRPYTRNGLTNTDKQTYFHVAHAGSGFKLQTGLGRRKLEKFGIWRDQPADAPGWAPNANQPDIQILGVYDAELRDLFLYNPTYAISVAADGSFSGIDGGGNGRLVLQNIFGHPIQFGLNITNTYDTSYVDNIHFWPYFSSGTNIRAWQQANGIAYRLGRVDNWNFGKLFSLGYNYGLIFFNQSDLGIATAPGGVASLIHIDSFGADSCNTGISLPSGADGITLSIDSAYVHGSGAGTTKVNIAGNNNEVNIASLDTQLGPTAVAISGSGNDLKIGRYRSLGTTTTEFSVSAGNRLTLATKPKTTAPTVYAGSGTIDTPDWVPFTPTISPSSGAITTVGTLDCKYKLQGSTLAFDMVINITTNGTGTGTLFATMPLAAKRVGAVGTGKTASAQVNGTIQSATPRMDINTYNNGYPGADGAIIRISGQYEVA